MTTNLETPPKTTVPPPEALQLPSDLTGKLKFAQPSDGDMTELAGLRSSSGPWKERGETQDESLAALTKLRPFVQVGKFDGKMVGYVSVERDGPVPGAAYMRNIVVKVEARKRGVGMMLLGQALQVARDMNRKTLALRVDPANSSAVQFYRKAGFTTVATVTSKKSGKLRLLMSREL
ncbi:MAG: GNAT family N-acetyltransferase [Myxococcaceae bacterium]|nr:GNAT family N-acetyltransferase [Myxococcaceae bacterium]